MASWIRLSVKPQGSCSTLLVFLLYTVPVTGLRTEGTLDKGLQVGAEGNTVGDDVVLGLGVLVADKETVLEGVFEGVLVAVRLEVGVFVAVGVPVGVTLGVPVPEGVEVEERVFVVVGVTDEVGVFEGV